MFDEVTTGDFDVFTDLLFNALVGFTFLFFVAFTLINPEAESGKVDTDVEILITVSWPDGLEDDIDVYVRDPIGNIVWYHKREAGLMHLDRDDRGLFKDILLINGEEVANLLNQETASVRGLMNGEYTINVVHFIQASFDPVPVTVRVEKLNPKVRVVFYGGVELNRTGQEETVVRFTLDGDTYGDINNREVSLVRATRATQPKSGSADVDIGSGEVIRQ